MVEIEWYAGGGQDSLQFAFGLLLLESATHPWRARGHLLLILLPTELERL